MSDYTHERYYQVSETDKRRRIEMIGRFITQHLDMIEGYEAERDALLKELKDEE